MPKSCQLVLFSATFPDVVREFAGRLAPSANEIRLKQEELSVDLIKQFYMDCKNEDHKYDILVELYNLLTIGQSIIFCAVRDDAAESADQLLTQRLRAETRDGRPDSTAHDVRGPQGRLAARQARDGGPRPDHRCLPRRQEQG